MPTQAGFKRLYPEQIESLFNEYGHALRLDYIDVLTLLQDLLGRYSSKGNATVFSHPAEAQSLLSEALSKVRNFNMESEPEDLNVPKVTTKSNKVDTLEKPYTKVFHVRIENTLEKPDALGWRRLPSKQRVSIREFGDLMWAKDCEESSEGSKGDYQVQVVVNYRSKTLTIYQQLFEISKFTVEDFQRAVGLTDKYNTSQEAYRELMSQIIRLGRQFPSSVRDTRREQLAKELHKAVLTSASNNTMVGLRLKAECEGQSRVSATVIKGVDEFLADLLNEYQVLRKPVSVKPRPTGVSQHVTPAMRRKKGKLEERR